MDFARERVRMRDNELLKRERSLRRSRIGAVLLIILVLFFAPARDNRPETPPSMSRAEVRLLLKGFCLLLAALAYQYHLQLKHIESIKVYRQNIEELKQLDPPQS